MTRGDRLSVAMSVPTVLFVVISLCSVSSAGAFLASQAIRSRSVASLAFIPPPSFRVVGVQGLSLSSGEQEADEVASKDDDATSKYTPEEKEQIGNLVADDEWMGFSMELAELVRVAVIEDVKKTTRELTGKDEYKVGDISKALDEKVKDEVANLRGKEEYELGDLAIALDEASKQMTCELTGKEDYEFGDLSKELDTRVKGAAADFCGKDSYEVGDLSKEVDRRVQERVLEFTGKEYEFGDISREIENRRRKWVEGFLGKEAAENYQFGDITKKAISGFTGKDNYEFGDISKKLMGNMFGKRKRGGAKED